ncbi:hypothetical protein AGMMS49965_06440 [Bacteroidia bacterium]|nr:hypothetical protein AGMMS49965_06440 [Bacteroidia bacterium]
MFDKHIMEIRESQIIQLPKILDRRGNLSFIEGENHIPFAIRRTHWIYDVPGGEKRGGHAYKVCQEFIVALSGSFDVIVNDGKEEKTYHLNRSYYGLYIPAICRKDEFKKTHIGKGATIGANATILCGITIGKFAFVGAGAVVTKNVPDYAVVVGNPARQAGWMDENGDKQLKITN